MFSLGLQGPLNTVASLIGRIWFGLNQLYWERSDEVSTGGLLVFNSLKEGSEVAGTETLMVSALNDLIEYGRLVLRWLGEDLEQVTLIVVVHKNLLLLKDVNVFLNLNVDLSKSSAEVIIIGVGDLLQEFNTSCLHSLNSCDNIFCAHGNVLDTWTTVVIAEFLNLGHAKAVSWLVKWHLDTLVEVSHDG